MTENGIASRTVHVRISGRVQGVGYRAWTEWNASELGLAGWVRNNKDGCVEALFAGPEDAVGDILQRCGQGPPGAQVDRIDIIQEAGTVPDGFKVLPTV